MGRAKRAPPMPTIDTIVIGAGQAGLAASRCLAARGRDHVVLERGRVGARWHTETWDSLHLLTPNWMNTLPDWAYQGGDPDGFMSADEFAAHLTGYARSFAAPVEEDTGVEAVRRNGDGFVVVTDRGSYRAANVIVATGWCDQPAIPAVARDLDAGLAQLVPRDYRRPGELPPGGVLVVGASATGVQLADELRASGRDVTLAVGAHTRVPRRYRGIDIFWWLGRIGLLDRTIDQVPDAARARREPSLQLVGGRVHRSLDLTTLRAAGVRLVGRVVAGAGRRVQLAGDLPRTVADAHRGAARLLAAIDCHIDEQGLDDEVVVLDPEPMAKLPLEPAVEELDLRAEGIASVVWATGHRRNYDWLQVPVLDASGEIRQRRGVTPVPGLYVLGQRFQYRRNSNFIGGVGRDAAFVADHIAGTRSARRTA
jgi:putative flavoprotein involved in K+ transport